MMWIKAGILIAIPALINILFIKNKDVAFYFEVMSGIVATLIMLIMMGE